jgi:F-type H+-transporting ATPase subunit c
MSLKRKLWLCVTVVAVVVAIPMMAFAQTPGAPANKFDTDSWLALGAAIAIGLAALGGTIGQGRTAAAALEGIARQPGAAPRMQTPLIIGLAMIESLVLFAWAMAFLLQLKIGG